MLPSNLEYLEGFWKVQENTLCQLEKEIWGAWTDTGPFLSFPIEMLSTFKNPQPNKKGGNKGNAFSEYLEKPLFNGFFVCLVFLFLSLSTLLEVGSIPRLKVYVADNSRYLSVQWLSA